ncbi:hypothetical protein OAI60_00950 [Flavobacteriaceae bacterium]|nr:hypothetical protein [Flavobacteriaceae bacterium]
MKKAFLSFLFIFMITQSFAQDSKFYLGIGVGLASNGGDISSDNNYKSGININFLNTGYRFSESIGATVNLSSSGHPIDGTDSAIGIGVFSVGPMFTLPIGGMSLDIKPQYALSMKGVFRGDDVADIESIEFSGSGFLLSNSLIIGDGEGLDFSIDLDYLNGKFNEISGPGGTMDDESKYNSFRLGVGMRYNF